MTNIQVRALQLVLDQLNKHETYPAYAAVSRCCVAFDIPLAQKESILNSLQDEQAKQEANIREAKAWLVDFISDFKDKK